MRETPRPPRPSKARQDKTMNGHGIHELAESIVYVCALIADQPRAIDRYIDYFGETPSAVPSSTSRILAPVSNQWVATDIGRPWKGDMSDEHLLGGCSASFGRRVHRARDDSRRAGPSGANSLGGGISTLSARGNDQHLR